MIKKIDPRAEFSAKAQDCDDALTLLVTFLRNVDVAAAKLCEEGHRTLLGRLKQAMERDFQSEDARSELMGAAVHYYLASAEILERGDEAFSGRSVMTKNVYYTVARTYMSATAKMLQHAWLSLARYSEGKPN